MWTSQLYPMRRRKQIGDPRYSLAHPYSANLLIALPLEDGESANKCVVSGVREAADWERFKLEPWIGQRVAVVSLADRAARLQGAAGPGGLRASIDRGDPAEDSEIIARLAPERDFEQLAIALETDPGLQQKFFSVAVNNPYRIALQNLMASRAHAKEPSRRNWFGKRAKAPALLDLRNDGRFAVLGAKTQDGTYSSLVQKINSVARLRREPSRRMCVLTTLRDEGPYILEWIAYHRCLGVERFFVYSNDNKDGSDALLGALAKSGLITWIENLESSGNIQLKAYGHCLAAVPAILDYEWCALLDGDEFIALDQDLFAGLDAYLTWQEGKPVDVIALPWAIFWSSGHAVWTDEPSIERFNRQSTGSGLGKSLFRPRKVTFSYPHHPASTDHTIHLTVRENLGRQLHWPRGQMTGHDMPQSQYECAWINHYFSRSAEELLWKWSRGRGDSQTIAPFSDMPDSFVSSFMDYFAREGMEVADTVSRRLPAVRQEIQALLDLPGVRSARAHVIARRQEWADRTPSLVSQLRQQDLSQVKRAFLDLFAA